MSQGKVNHQAPCPMIEAVGATRLNIIFSVEIIYPCCSQLYAEKRRGPSFFWRKRHDRIV
jgi:hypothetical protein